MNTLVLLGALFSATSTWASMAELEKLFEGYNSCFILYDSVQNKDVVVLGSKRCAERLPACSAFKVALAAIGFDSGVLKDETEVFKWNGQKHSIESWNKDQTAASWMKDSVVWVSQEITPRLGAEKLTSYLRKFDYGTADVSGGLTTAWLTAASFLAKPPVTSLNISGREQVRFIDRLFGGELPVSPRALELTRKITFLENTPRGYAFYGKTGSGLVGPKRDLRLGWFVANLEKGTTERYVAIASVTDRIAKAGVPPYAGPEARELLKRALQRLSKW